MGKGEAQGAVSTHGKSGDAPRLAFPHHAIPGFDEWQELAEEKVAITFAPVGGIDKKTSPACGRNHKKVANLVIAPEVFDQPPATALQERLLVFAKPMQEIKNGIFRFGVSLIIRWQHDAVPHVAMKNAAVESAAVDSSLREGK